MGFRLKKDEFVLFAEIDRPEAMNAVDFEVMEGLEQALEILREDEDLRVFILRGAGSKAFISGGDLKVFHQLEKREDVRAMTDRMHEILNGFESLDVFTMACVNGLAYGGGIETFLAMDLVIAAEDARFGFTQTRFQLVPGWGGLTRLVHRVGQAKALRWLGTASVIDADEAHRAGLVDIVAAADELDTRARLEAEKLSKRSRAVIRALKEGARRAHQLPRDEAIAREIAPFIDLWMDEDHLSAVERFLKGEVK